MKHRNLPSFILYAAAASMLLELNCSAYIDPASTSYIIQIAAGLVIAGGTAIGIFWSKIKRLFRKKDAEETRPADSAPADTGEKKTVTAEDLLGDDDN